MTQGTSNASNSSGPSRLPLSPRRRRLRWTFGSLAALGVLGAVALVVHSFRSRPMEYRPGEKSDDITRSLAKGLPSDAPFPRFTDVTAASGLAGFRNFVGDRESELPEDMGPGLAWGDYDNDGDDDLFLVGAGGGMKVPASSLAACALFENLGNGGFRPVTAFPETRIRGLGAAWGDYDGDGYLDLAVAGYNALRLFHNESGSGRFTLDPRLPDRPGFWSSVAWTDFNRDRRLDLYVANYVRYATSDPGSREVSDQLGTAVPYTLNPASYEPGLNALYRQEPDGSFRDVAEEMRVQNPEGRSLGALWHDFDDDGWLDLYVANDVSDNVFFRNTGTGFEDISHSAWVADYRSAMGLAVGDFDRDGDDDLQVTHWTAQENALYENQWANLNRAGRPPASEGDAAGKSWSVRFVDIADRKGLGQIALRSVGWGTEFVDLDHDGWQELLVANGSTLEADGPRPKQLRAQPTFLFWNRRGEFFHDLAPLHPGLRAAHVSRGLACADFDNDGDMDIAIADLGEGVRLYRNDMAEGHWLKVRLRSRNADGTVNGFGRGSTVIAWIDGTPLRRSVTGASYLSQSSSILHWGLGDAAEVDRLEVRWHAGGTNVYARLQADARYEVLEGDPVARRFSGRSASSSAATPRPRAEALDEKQRLTKFWRVQRAAMDALKVEKDDTKAVRLLREALDLNPAHEDARYYLSVALTRRGQLEAALAELAVLQELNPRSQRAWQQWAALRARTATTDDALAAAELAAEQAHRINPEETGALLLLGEIALMRGNFPSARRRLGDACRTNPRAVGGFFLLAFIAREQGRRDEARGLLAKAREALGPDWQPQGATSEGDVLEKHYTDTTPLAPCWSSWDGKTTPETAFASLEERLGRIALPARDSVRP